MDFSKYHLNTVYVKSQDQLMQGPYQALKNQLSRENFFNPRYIEKSTQTNMQQAMDQLNKLMSGGSSIDYNKLAHIHSIKLHPIINQNFISSFDQNEYRLQAQDKVKIVKEKVFRVQNYYNYLYELKCKEEHERIQGKVEEVLRQAKHFKKEEVGNGYEGRGGNKKQKIGQNQPNSFNEDQIPRNPDSRADSKDMSLAPSYNKYEQRQVEGQRYFLKEKQRKKIQESMYKRF